MKRILYVMVMCMLAIPTYAQIGNSVLYPLVRTSSCLPGMDQIQYGGNIDPTDDVAGGCYVYEYIGPIYPGQFVYSAQEQNFTIYDPIDMTQETYNAQMWNMLSTPDGCPNFGQMSAGANWEQGYIDQQDVSHDALMDVDVICGGDTCNYQQSIYWYGSKLKPDDPFGSGLPFCY